jgi:CubicO group peptidase (beta-lactamase class C family)
VLRNGQVAFEAYHQGFTPLDHHLWMSCTKSLVGLCVGILADEGRIDPEAPILDYLPELASSGFAGATVRQVLDMTTAIDFQESRMVAAVTAGEDAATEVRWARVQRWAPPPARAAADGHPGCPAILAAIPAHPGAVHGERMSYESPNTDVLGWLVVRVGGQPLPAFVSERIWQRIGAAHDGFFITDAAGDANAHGGFNSTLEDLARLGLVVADGGGRDGEQLLPRAWIDDLTAPPAPESEAAWRASAYDDPAARVYSPRLQGYRSQWWVIDRARGVFTASGVHGQMLFVNRSAGVVAAAFATRPDTTNMASPAFKALLAGLDAWAEAGV